MKFYKENIHIIYLITVTKPNVFTYLLTICAFNDWKTCLNLLLASLDMQTLKKGTYIFSI